MTISAAYDDANRTISVIAQDI